MPLNFYYQYWYSFRTYADKPNDKDDVIVRCSVALSFQFPKFSFNATKPRIYVPDFEILDIGLDKTFIQNISTPHFYITKWFTTFIKTPCKIFS